MRFFDVRYPDLVANPLAMADAILRKKEVLKRGDGPVLLDVVTYRFSGRDFRLTDVAGNVVKGVLA